MKAKLGLWLVAVMAVVASASGREPARCEGDEVAAVVFFVLEDCPVSNALVPEMERTVKAYSEKGVRFTYVYINPKLGGEAMAAHVEEYGLTAATVIDREHRVVAKAGATVTPEAAVFRKDGQLAYCGRINNLYVGFGKKRQVVNEYDLKDALDAVLAGKVKIPKARAKAVGCYIADYKR